MVLYTRYQRFRYIWCERQAGKVNYTSRETNYLCNKYCTIR